MKNILLISSILCSLVFFGCSVQGPEYPAGPVSAADDHYDGEMFPLSLTMSNFGIYSDSVPFSVRWGIDTVTNFMTNSSSRLVMVGITNQCGEGNHAWELVGTGTLMGMTINVNPATALKDMRFYTNGSLKFMYRGTKGIRVGIRSGGTSPVSKLMQMTNGRFGFFTNNSWCSVTLPLSLFSGVDFSKIEWYFMALVADLISPLPSPSTPISPLFSQLTVFFLDNIYWTAPVPPVVIDTNKALVLYSDTMRQNVTWGVDINTNESPSDPNQLSFTNNTAGEGPNSLRIKVNSNMFNVNLLRFPLVTYLDLSAYANGSLRFMVKATKGISVSIHMAENYDIMEHLSNGNYGFYTNNTWCSVVIPMSNYIKRGVNLKSLYGWLKFYGGYYEGVAGGEEYYLDNIFFYKQ